MAERRARLKSRQLLTVSLHTHNTFYMRAYHLTMTLVRYSRLINPDRRCPAILHPTASYGGVDIIPLKRHLIHYVY